MSFLIYQQQTELALTKIFSKVNQIGTPKRKNVTSIPDFIKKAVAYHSSNPIYADVHEYQVEKVRNGRDIYHPEKVNKLYFDFDSGEHDKKLVEKEMDMVISNLIERGVRRQDVLKVWTFGKGGHLYVNIKSQYFQDMDVADKTEYKLKYLSLQHGVSQCNCGGRDPHLLHTVDTQVMGDFSRISRVPGIQRSDNGKIPTVISCDKPLNKWIGENRGWEKLVESGTQILEKWGGKAQSSVDDLLRPDDQIFYVRTQKIYATKNYLVSPILNKPLENYNDNLRIIFKQANVPMSMVDRILEPYANNKDRITVATYLVDYGLNSEIITNLFALIGWKNFNYGTTKTHIDGIASSNGVWRRN